MEAVAIGASILAFIQVADRVIDLCKSYLESVRDAPSDLRKILVETSALRAILENLQFLRSCDHGPATLHLPHLERSITECLMAITEMEGLFPSSSSTHPVSSKRRKARITLKALAWPLKENRAKKLLGEMVQHKTTISLALTTESL